MNVNIVQTKMEETSDASKQQGVDDVGAHHYFRLKTVKQQQHHHDNAARADRSDAHQEPSHQADDRHPCERLHRRRPHRYAVFDLFLEEQESGNANQQNSHCKGDEMIDAIAINVSQVNQKTNAQIGSGGAAGGQGQHDFSANRALAQMNDAGADLGEEVEERVRAHGSKRRYTQAEDQDRKQQNAASDTRHSDQCSYSKTDQTLDQQIHDSTRLQPFSRMLASTA